MKYFLAFTVLVMIVLLTSPVLGLLVTPVNIQTQTNNLTYLLANPTHNNLSVEILSSCIDVSKNLTLKPSEEKKVNLVLNTETNCTIEYQYTAESNTIQYSLFATVQYISVEPAAKSKIKNLQVLLLIGGVALILLIGILTYKFKSFKTLAH